MKKALVAVLAVCAIGGGIAGLVTYKKKQKSIQVEQECKDMKAKGKVDKAYETALANCNRINPMVFEAPGIIN